jgi:hypothetical protein
LKNNWKFDRPLKNALMRETRIQGLFFTQPRKQELKTGPKISTGGQISNYFASHSSFVAV